MEKLVAEIKTGGLTHYSHGQKSLKKDKYNTTFPCPLSLSGSTSLHCPTPSQPQQMQEDGELDGYSQSNTSLCCSFLLTLF